MVALRFLSRAFHPIVGFLSGWVSLLVGFSAPIALTAHAFGVYTSAAYPGLSAKLSGAVLITLLTIAQTAWIGDSHQDCARS